MKIIIPRTNKKYPSTCANLLSPREKRGNKNQGRSENFSPLSIFTESCSETLAKIVT